MSHLRGYFAEASEVLGRLDLSTLNLMVEQLIKLRQASGRLFIVGVGGSAANASHAVNDFRKLCGIEAYSPFDNVSELTARTNDEGWETVIEAWLQVSQASAKDMLLVLSVGGGNAEKNVSVNLVRGVDEAKRRGMVVLGIVGRDGGHTKQKGDYVLVIPTVNNNHITPHAESFQSVVLHGITCDPRLQRGANKWEGLATDVTARITEIGSLKTQIFADGANIDGMLEMAKRPYIAGFTTNPTLMRKAGVTDYEVFARGVLQAIPDRPVSFEVLSDDFPTMELQARKIASWGSNVYVKIPITNTKGESAIPLIARLSQSGVKVNVTAVMTSQQIQQVAQALADHTASYLSVFAGRISDTGRDPVPLVKEALDAVRGKPCEVIWASPRELLNIFQANEIGCHIITVTNDILDKLRFVGKSLESYSLDTVKMFFNDAVHAGLSISTSSAAETQQIPRDSTAVLGHSAESIGKEIEAVQQAILKLGERMKVLEGRLQKGPSSTSTGKLEVRVVD